MSNALFRSVAPHVGAPLLAADLFERLSVLREVIPAAFVSFYIECRLARGEGQVDLLAGTTSRVPLSRALDVMDSPSWNALRRVAQGWCQTPELQSIPCVWIEFDDIAASVEGDALSLAVCLDPGYPITSGHGADNLELARHVIERLALEDVTRQRPALSRFFAALPSHGRVIHLSPMTGRRRSPLKLYGRVPVDTLGAFLARAEWDGSDAQVSYLQHEIWEPCSTSPDLYFDVAVAPDGPSSIGVVFSPPELRASANADKRRIGLLRHLTALGICDPDKADALSEWVGDDRLQDPSVPFPCRVERWLDIKVVAEPGRTFAKAYLGVRRYRTLF